MLKPQSDEQVLTGEWKFDGHQVRGDAVCERIKWLTDNYLKKIAYSPESGAWETLYKDPGDGRYWEKTYPKSEMHGGGATST